MDRPRQAFKAVERGQYGIELGPATSDPVDEYPLARPSPLITDRNSLVTSGRCRGQDPETPAARLSRDWHMEDILASTPPEALGAMLAGTTATVLAGGHYAYTADEL